MKVIEEILEVLEPWQEALKEVEAAFEGVEKIFGCNPEGPLFLALEALMELATKNAAQVIGCHPGWLTVWWLEQDFGDNPMKMRCNVTGDWHEASTLPELAALIHRDMQL